MKYKGNILDLAKRLNMKAELLEHNHAIISSSSIINIDNLLVYDEIEQIEKIITILPKYSHSTLNDEIEKTYTRGGNREEEVSCKSININDQYEDVEIYIRIGESEKSLTINLYTDFQGDFNLRIVSPSKLKSYEISNQSGIIKNIIGKTKIKGDIQKIGSSLTKRKAEVKMSSTSLIETGIWKIVITPKNMISGKLEIEMNSSDALSEETKIFMIDRDVEDNIDYLNNCMGYSHFNLDKLDFEELILKRDYNNYKDSRSQTKTIGWGKLPEIYRENIEIEGFLPRFGVIHGPEFEESFKSLGESYKFLNLGDSLGIIFIKPETKANVKKIVTLKGFVKLEEISNLAVLGDIREGTSGGVVAITEIGADFLKNNPNISITGKGVIIGVIDTGIDYLHKDFIYPDGTSKIVYLWDQSKEGKPPKEYLVGTEYTREDINKAIANNDSSLSKDEVGHGTAISGICAGMGNINKAYAGVAEDAELVVVKLAKINGYYNNVTLVTAIEYVYKKALELKRPVVINISLGSNLSIGLNSKLLFNEEFFPYLTRGLFLVAGAGNEGNTATHATGKLKFTGDSINVEIEVSDQEKNLEIQVLVNKPDKIMVSIISPMGESSKSLEVQNYEEITGVFDLEGSKYRILYIYPTSYSGQQETRIRISNASKGIWRINLKGEYILNGVYHLFLPNRVFLKPGTKFRQPDPSYTIAYPATFKEIVAVGAYDTMNKGLWPTSSRGPTVDGLYKPAIVAPGVNIIAPYPGNTYGTVTGTAAAAAHVSGALALYLQYVLVDKAYTDRAFIQQARTYLKAGADRNINRTYPNNDYGYGVLNIRGMFEQLK